MQLFLARHGETSANRRGIVLGRNDSPLTDSGMETARRLGGILRGGFIQEILVSPLGRAVATASIIAGMIGIAPVITHRLTELSCGRWEGGRRADMARGLGALRSTWTDRPPGGESCRDAEPRVVALMDRILERLDSGSILMIGHAVINRVFLKIWCELDPAFANRLIQPHDLVYVLTGNAPIGWLRADASTGTGLLYSTG